METKHKKFQPYDRVLVRGHNPIWKPDLYAYWNESIDAHQVIGFGTVLDGYILPYEGNEYLVGTADEPEEEVKLKEGEWLICSDTPNVKECSWRLRKYIKTTDTGFYVEEAITATQVLTYAICFSNFNPNDMEETRKHILCVKNGKIVRYKE